jgi:OmcA/MtrC family decaheme c-type cytochrome
VQNCRTCHDNQSPKILPSQPADRAAADKMAWMNNISKQACNTCHAVDFTNHFGNQPDNVQCTVCHGDGRSLPVNVAHATPYPTPNNPELVTGAKKVEYEITSVTVNADRQPTVKFRVLVDGAPVNLQALPAGITVGGVNLRMAWSAPMPQPVDLANGPAIAAPLDWNNFGTNAGRSFWNGPLNIQTGTATAPAAGTFTVAAFDQPPGFNVSAIVASLTYDAATGTHTTVAGLSPTTPLAFPVSTKLRAVAIESYLTINNMNISGNAVLKGVDGDAAGTQRRGSFGATVVDIDSCNTCHERVGFHSNAGRMNSPEYCSTCHNPELSSSNVFAGVASYGPYVNTQFSQRPNNFKDMIHAIHAGAERKAQNASDPFNFIRGNPNATGGNGPMVFENVVYPAQISDCQSCHKPGTYGLPNNASYAWSVQKAALDNDATGLTGGLGSITTFSPAKMFRVGPATAACGTCHNSESAKAHFALNTATSIGAESCGTCHGPGRQNEAHAD